MAIVNDLFFPSYKKMFTCPNVKTKERREGGGDAEEGDDGIGVGDEGGEAEQ